MNGGGRVYWGGSAVEAGESNGVVVLFAWSSISDELLENYVDLYSSLGWNSLVSRADFVSFFHPGLATSLAFTLLNELVEELKIRPSPVVFVAFSGAPKTCMYKVFQIIQGACEAHLQPDESQLVRNCLSGLIYDSGPLDFTSDSSAKFALHPTVRRMTGPSKLVSWMAKGIASGLDGLYLTKFESQREEYWQTLYSSVELEAPNLFLFSENDDLAPHQVICRFVQNLQDLGGQVKVVKWNKSPHLGHYEHHPVQYRAAVSNFLEKAASIYCHKIRQLRDRPHMQDEISDLICDLQEAAVDSNQSLRRVAKGPRDHFFLPSSAPYQTGNTDCASSQDEPRERSLFHLPQPTSINAHSVLGQFLFDACVPKNIEGWDIRFAGSLNRQPYASVRRNSHFPTIKRKHHSRL